MVKTMVSDIDFPLNQSNDIWERSLIYWSFTQMRILSGFADDLMISLLIFGMIRNNYNPAIRECRKS